MGVVVFIAIVIFVVLFVKIQDGKSNIASLKRDLDYAKRSAKVAEDKLQNAENEWKTLSEIINQKFDDVFLRERLKKAVADWEYSYGAEVKSRLRGEAEREAKDIIAQAKAEAQQISAEAKAQADRISTEAKAIKDESDQRIFLVRQRAEALERQVKVFLEKPGDATINWLARQFSNFLADTEAETQRLWTQRAKAAPRAEQICKEEAAKRRDAEQGLRRYRLKCEYYENLFPFLKDIIDEDSDTLVQTSFWDGDENPETLDDESAQWLTKEEYHKLNSVEKGQLALDRWQRRHKTRWEIGMEYEDYVGWEYEQRGFSVEYVGMAKGFEDMGRDLICRKGQTIHVVQCKRWSSESIIHEKHINQLLGTSIEYAIQHKYCMRQFNINYNPSSLFALKHITPVFYTTTALTDTARSFAAALGVEVHENHPLQAYPQIKCNISKDREKIYHLPFDQQYKTTKVSAPGECRVLTVAEAEERGFRRAKRHFKGNTT